MSAEDTRAILLQKGIAVSRRSTLVLVVLSVAKGTAGFLSGSIALLADAAHTIMDIVGSVVVWLGLRLSLRRPTDRFPYGFYKAESICALIVCIIMIFTGAEILRDSIERFYVPSVISFRPVVIAVAIGAGFVSYFLARYKEKAGREINSQGLRVESRLSGRRVEFRSGCLTPAGDEKGNRRHGSRHSRGKGCSRIKGQEIGAVHFRGSTY